MRIWRPIHAGFALLAVVTAMSASCAHHAKQASRPTPPAHAGKTEIGIASWYGAPYHGRQTASGEIYDMYKFTAAHRNLPFQTWVDVENLSNGKHVDVRINDRGPFVRHRVIDLSRTAAKEIDMLGPGTARVRLTVISTPTKLGGEKSPAISPAAPGAKQDPRLPTPSVTPTAIPSDTQGSAPAPASSRTPTVAAASRPSAIPTTLYTVQAGAFADRDRAEAMRVAMVEAFADARTSMDAAHAPPQWRVLVGREMTRAQADELATRVRSQVGGAIVVPEMGNYPQ